MEQLTIWDRLNLPTSKFFKPIKTTSIIATLISGVLVALETKLTEAGIPVPKVLLDAIGLMGVVSYLISALTVDVEAPQTKALIQQKTV